MGTANCGVLKVYEMRMGFCMSIIVDDQRLETSARVIKLNGPVSSIEV